jgi:hypothetical protein
MEDIIDIIVTETTNLIEITSQPTDEIIDVNIIDNREDITLNVTPSVVEININSLTGNFGVNWGEIGGTLSNQTDLNTALGLKADLVDGKVPSSQLPSYVDDVVEVATYSALPVIGEVGKIYVVLDTNFIYRWSGSAYIEIKDSSAVWGAITGTLSSQTDLQTALNAKFDDPTGDTTQYIAGDGSLITFPIAGQAGTLVREVRNTTGATLTKGTIVYISGATGNKPTVSKALATGDSTSAQTFGLCQADIANNANGYVVCTGDIVGLDTSAISEGVQLYLSSTTAGTYTTTKQFAPAHLVYIGVVTRSHPTQGQIEVKIQNGYELEELHNVSAQTPSNNDGLFYESSTSLWKNKSIATVLGYTPQAQLNGTGFVKASGTTISYDNSTYLTTSAATSTYLALGGGTMTGVLFGASASFSGYVGFGGNTSPLYPLDVTGAGRFSGQLILNSTISNGTYTYTLPGATGTLALTSALSSYLPLSGGTLTGALSGTSATFSQAVTVTTLGNDGLVILGRSDNYAIQRFKSANGVTTYATIYSPASGVLRFESNGVQGLELGTTGAATFSSSVTATQIGLGVSTLPTWTGAKAIQAGLAGSFYGDGLVYGWQTGMAANAYRTGATTWAYNNTGVVAARVEMSEINTFTVFGAPAGTAGNAITFTPLLTVNPSGNVGIGTTAPQGGGGSTDRTLSINSGASAASFVTGLVGDVKYSTLFTSSSEFTIETNAAIPIKFNTNGILRAQFTSNGLLGIGVTTNIINESSLAASSNGNTVTFKSSLNGGNPLLLWNSASGTQSQISFFTGTSYTAAGGITSNGTVTSYNVTSDYRLKEDFKKIKGLEIVSKINVYDFKWKSSENRMDGVIAHELADVLPYAVVGVKDGEQMQQVDYSKIVPVMVQAIKELKLKIETLENK